MNPNRPHEELDDDERELARVVRALPGNEPSPALDLRILKAAQDAVATTPGKRGRRALWASSTGGGFWVFGTAAAAVLAVGVSWQMFMRVPTANFPASGPAPVAEESAQDRDATAVDFRAAPKLEAPAPLAEANQPMQLKQRAAAAAEPMRQRENERSFAGPQPFLDEHVASTSKIAETEGQKSDDLRADTGAAAQKPMTGNAIADNAAPASAPVATMAAPALEQAAPTAAAPPPPMDAERREQAAPVMAKSATAVGALAGAAAPAGQSVAESPAAARTRVRADVRLYPESWLRKIRSRLQKGDVSGARASLKLFVEAYPQATVPDNLKPLLEE